MPQILTVPNWSFGRDKFLLNRFRGILEDHLVHVHFCESDIDHNRTVTAFSGHIEPVFSALEKLAEAAFDVIDLRRHSGVHPRIGALDVCPFLNIPDEAGSYTQEELQLRMDEFAVKLSAQHQIPIFYYEKSERGRHEADLPTLRKGGFGGLIGKKLSPDVGPEFAHERLGVTVMGIRDFLIAFNINFRDTNDKIARSVARQMRHLRAEGDPDFLGVRALGFYLATRELAQVSINVTLPDLTSIDQIVTRAISFLREHDRAIAETELIGVIRDKDLHNATYLKVKEAQIVKLRVSP